MLRNNNKKFYKIVMPRGHVGTGNSGEITFFIEAFNGYDATKQAQKMPSVKHSAFPISMTEITEEEYRAGRKVSAYHTSKTEMCAHWVKNQRRY